LSNCWKTEQQDVKTQPTTTARVKKTSLLAESSKSIRFRPVVPLFEVSNRYPNQCSDYVLITLNILQRSPII